MAFTDNCDVFGSFHEDGFNRIVGHIRRQRPSLFNYATAAVASNPEAWCKAVDAHPIVFARNNPLFTLVDPLPVPGTSHGINFIVQLSDLRIDFHPGGQFDLPPELSPPLKAQRLAIKLSVCGGIGCPPKDVVDRLIPPPPRSRDVKPNDERPPPKAQLTPLPMRQITCFCIDAFATAGVRIATYDGQPWLEPFLDGFEIVDIRPEGLESTLECYISLILRLNVLPGLRVLLKDFALNLTQGAPDLFPQPTGIILKPMPTSPALPNNPSIDANQLKAFIKVEKL